MLPGGRRATVAVVVYAGDPGSEEVRYYVGPGRLSSFYWGEDLKAAPKGRGRRNRHE